MKAWVSRLGRVAWVCTAARAALACAGGVGPATPPRAPTPTAHADAAAGRRALHVDAGTLASFEVLGERAAREGPGLREVARGELAVGQTQGLVLAPDADVCLRVIYSAVPPSRLTLTRANASTAPERDAGAPTGDGLVGDDGPVCFARAEAPRVTNVGPGRVRFVVVSSP